MELCREMLKFKLQDVAGKTVIYSSHVLSDLGDFDVTVSKSPQPKNLSKHLSPLERKFKPTWPHDFCCK